MNTTVFPAFRNVLLLLGAVLIAGVLFASDSQPVLGASYIVDTTSDATLTTCAGGGNDCSLRGAIINAVANAGADTITFDPTDFPPTSLTGTDIDLGSGLPNLSNNGDTINGSGAGVAIDGFPGSFTCLQVSGNSNTIVGIRAFKNCNLAISVSGASNTIGGINQPESVCTGSADNDSDGFPNDGCPRAGATAETGGQCSDTINDDSGDDSLTNDGCPARGEGIRFFDNVIGINTLGATNTQILGNHIGLTNALDGDSGNTVGIQAFGDSTAIGNGTAGGGNLISGNATAGIEISGTNTAVVRGNTIGLDATGTSAVANDYGIYLYPNTSGVTIGGTVAGDRNIISGNTTAGVYAESVISVAITGNYIGTNASGTGPLAQDVGLLVSGTAVTVGGTTAAARNVISGNGDGVVIEGMDEDDTRCSGSVDEDLDTFVNDGCPQVGATAESGAQCSNAVNDDSGDDSWVNDGCPTVGNTVATVAGNYIGVDPTGTAALANSRDGVEIRGPGVSGTTIGSAKAAESVCTGSADEDSDGYINDGCNAVGVSSELQANCANATDDDSGDSDGRVNDGCPSRGGDNVISGNGYGVHIQGPGASGNFVKGNLIGSDSNWASELIRNSLGGVLITNGAQSNTVGGSVDGEYNTIVSNSGAAAVDISGATTSGNIVKYNNIGVAPCNCLILNNSGAGIRVSAPSNTIGSPLLSERNLIGGNQGGGVLITGSSATGNVVKGNFIGTQGSGGLANTGNGVTISAGATGNTIGGTVAGDRNVISANTLEGVHISSSNSNIVRGNYIGITGDGNGDLGNAGSGVFISGVSAGNTIGGTSTGDRNVISGNDGWAGVTVAGADADNNTVTGNYIGTNAAGTGDIGNLNRGVSIESGNGNTIGGSTTAARNVISGNDGYGLNILNSASGNTILGNYIGVDATGTTGLGNGADGVYIDSAASGNTIGGSTAGARNVISGNTGDGVEINGVTTTGNVVKGNYIGTNAAGMADISSQSAGVRTVSVVATIGGTVGVTPGGSCTGECNLISGNGTGVFADGAGVTLKGNYIGTNVTGTAALGNSAAGVTVQSTFAGGLIGGSTPAEANIVSGNNRGVDLMGTAATILYGNYIGTNVAGANIGNAGFGVEADSFSDNNVIGGVSAGQGNVIAFNGIDGVVVQDSSATGNSIRGNSIHSNTGLGIDLNPDGVTPNDPYPDSDSGANNLMNHPVISAASYNGATTTLTVSGSLDTGSPETTAVDVYSTDIIDGSGYGEGREYLGTATPNGSGAWTLNRVGPLPVYGYITATATKPADGTSEFSLGFDPDIDGDGFPSSTDNCDVDYNPLQIDHDSDGIGDVCDTAVRNRYSAASSSVVTEYTSAPGENIPADTRAFHSWDYQPGSSIDVGAGMGRIEMAFRIGLNNAPCVAGVSYTGGSDIELFNGSLDNSPGNLVNSSALRSDTDLDGIVNGIEGYPRFLNTFLDPDGVTGIDDDGDGAVDEDPADGINNDADSFMDEDPTGTPIVPHARYFGVYGLSSVIQVLVFEEVANSRYRVVVLTGDPTLGPSFLPGEIFCGPFEIRTTIDTTSSANGSVPGGDTVHNTPAAGTHLFRLETVPPPDADADGVANVYDNCPATANTDQSDPDSDAIGTVCEPTSGPCNGNSVVDCDGDGYSNSSDNCATTVNGTQVESEKRQPLPFGLGYVRDGLGDACDNNPLSFDLGNAVRINRYSDPICVGLTDGDADGWCDADESGTTGDGTRTPEGIGLGGDAASCINGVDDDGDALIDFADPGCPDADGDRIINSVDVCTDAADPLQLDTDSFTTGGDACHALPGGDNPVIAELHAYPKRANAHSTMRGRFVEPAPRILHNLSTGYIETTDADWTIVPGSSIANGAIRETVTALIDSTIFPSHTCNTPLPFTFTLLDASTDYSQTVEPGVNFGGLVADSDADGLPNGVELMPFFLTTAAILDDDGDGDVDEDPANALDDDGDGRIDEDRAPIARLFGSIGPPHGTMVMNVMVYAPEQTNNDGDGATNEDPPGDVDTNGSIDDDGDGEVDEDGPEGYTSHFLLGDPGGSAIVGSVSAFCTPLEARRMRLGITSDNPRTAANEAGAASLVNSPTGGTQLFYTDLIDYPDADGDQIENTLDICVFDPDNDDDSVNDDIDATPWNPRLVSPPGDPDGDGLPEACEVSGGAGGSGFVFPQAIGCATTVDCDGDNIENQEDNCPFVPNPYVLGLQPDSDNDGIGDACDILTQFPDGAIQRFSGGTPQCTESATVVDLDRDEYCAGVDPNDNSVNPVGGFPEFSGFNPSLCTNGRDDDGDWPGPPGSGIDFDGPGGTQPDAGCADLDNDLVPDYLDNCPKVANPSQADLDGDSGPNIGQQPFLRSATGESTGNPPSPFLGQPFLRSDKWGGDACDADADGDLLPNSNEPGGTCPAPIGGTPATRKDCDGDNLTDMFEYIFSPLCQNNPEFTCPSSTCLNMFSDNSDSVGLKDGLAESEPSGQADGLFNYGEQTLYVAVMGEIPAYSGPSPCVNDVGGNQDAGTIDSSRDGLERYLGTLHTLRCSPNAGANNDPPPDAHPHDFNDDKIFNTTDVGGFVTRLNKTGPGNGYVARYDLNGNLSVNTSDIGGFVALLNKPCN